MKDVIITMEVLRWSCDVGLGQNEWVSWSGRERRRDASQNHRTGAVSGIVLVTFLEVARRSRRSPL